MHTANLERQINEHVGRRLRLLRQRRSVSQASLAKLLGISFQQIQKYERGTNRISAGKLFLVSKLLGVSVTWFFRELGSSSQE